MKLQKFKYYEPQQLEEAFSLLDRYGDDAAVLAGGTDLVPLMKERAVQPKCVINIKRIKDLEFIKSGEALEIGPLTTIGAIEKSAILRKKCPLLSYVAGRMAYVQVRNIGTIGGNICNASPAADFAPSLLVLDAAVEISSINGKRSVSIRDFFLGPAKTILGKNEMVTGLHLPGVSVGSVYAFKKVASRTSKGLAVASVAVTSSIDHNSGIIRAASIAVGSMGPTPLRCTKTEKMLFGEKVSQKILEITSEEIAKETKPISDIRGTKQYRIQLIKAITREALMGIYRRYLN
jgi:carbon-monoxide dehydrogenase medium subunit